LHWANLNIELVSFHVIYLQYSDDLVTAGQMAPLSHTQKAALMQIEEAYSQLAPFTAENFARLPDFKMSQVEQAHRELLKLLEVPDLNLKEGMWNICKSERKYSLL